MLSEEEICEWWNRKIENYLKNYARRNKLTLTQNTVTDLTRTLPSSRFFGGHI